MAVNGGGSRVGVEDDNLTRAGGELILYDRQHSVGRIPNVDDLEGEGRTGGGVVGDGAAVATNLFAIVDGNFDDAHGVRFTVGDAADARHRPFPPVNPRGRGEQQVRLQQAVPPPRPRPHARLAAGEN